MIQLGLRFLNSPKGFEQPVWRDLTKGRSLREPVNYFRADSVSLGSEPSISPSLWVICFSYLESLV